MTLELLFPHFDELIRTPEDVQRLNEAILQLAVQGKLVPQDPEDEPASELLRRIQAQQQTWTEDGSTVSNMSLPLIPEEMISNALPFNWVWARLDEVAEVIMGQSPPGNSYNSDGDGIPLINGPVEFSDGPFGETQRTKFTIAPTKLCKAGDLLLCVRGSTTGRTNIAGFDACIGRGVAAIRSYASQSYLNHYILSQRQRIFNLGTGSTFPSVSQDKIRELLVPLPPLAEQHRIVAKVNELFVQTRALEASLRQAQADIVTANRAALHRLHTAQDDDQFQAAWRTLRDHFDLLYDDPRNVAELRQAILDLAVRGKLVPEDPGDEPAEESLTEIDTESNQAVTDESMEKADPPPSLKALEQLPALPPSWHWTRLDTVSHVVTDGEHATPPRSLSGVIPLASAKNIRDGHLDLGVTDFVDLDVAERCWQRCKPEHNDVLMVCVGATTGRLCLANRPPDIVLVRSVALIRPNTIFVLPEYLNVAMRSPSMQNQIWASVKRTAQPCLYINRMKALIVALPPLAEQHRIVAKVDQLMQLCDALEAGLLHAQPGRQGLVEAVLHGVAAG